MSYALIIILSTLCTLNNLFSIEKEYNIPESIQVSGENAWTDWSYCSVNYSGTKAAFINPKNHNVVSLEIDKSDLEIASPHTSNMSSVSHFTTTDIESFNPNSLISKVVSNGRKKNEVALPVSIHYTHDNNLLICDNNNRRILITDNDNKYISSFLLTGKTAVPNEIRKLADGTFLAAGLNLDYTGNINAGNYCTIYSSKGELLRSFAYTPQVAFDSTLWIGVASLIDIDDAGNIYQTFSVDSKINVYDIFGKLLRTLNYKPKWFYPPNSLQEPHSTLENEPPGFWKSWPRIIKILYLGNNKLLIAAETNGIAEGFGKRFIFDIITTNGQILYSGIPSDYLPVGRDKDNNIYFLSLKGDKLIKTYLSEGNHNE